MAYIKTNDFPAEPSTAVDNSYRETLEQMKREIILRKKQLGDAIKLQEDLETRIAHLQGTAVAIARMLGEEYLPEDAMGLTDAIRQVFKTAPAAQITPMGVRARLQQMGFDITEYGNVLASIHSVLARLERGGEIRHAANTAEGKAFVLKQ